MPAPAVGHVPDVTARSAPMESALILVRPVCHAMNPHPSGPATVPGLSRRSLPTGARPGIGLLLLENRGALEFGFSHTTSGRHWRYGFQRTSDLGGNNTDARLWVGGSVDIPLSILRKKMSVFGQKASRLRTRRTDPMDVAVRSSFGPSPTRIARVIRLAFSSGKAYKQKSGNHEDANCFTCTQ